MHPRLHKSELLYVILSFSNSGLTYSAVPTHEFERAFSFCSEIIFDVPKCGIWEWRLFSDNSYVDVARSTLVINGEDKLELLYVDAKVPQVFIEITLQTKDIVNDHPWVGIYHVEEKNYRMYRRYKYLATTGKSTVQFKAAIHTGIYEARLYAGSCDTVVAVSAKLNIQGI